MKRLSRWFINGLLAFLPISITLYVTWWIANLAEGVFGAPLRAWLGVRQEDDTGYYFYGLGLVAMFCILIVIGFFLEFYIGRTMMSWGESILSKIPGVKQIYSSIKEILDFFNPGKKRNKNNYMVLVNITKEVRTMGYVTRDTMERFRGGQFGDADDVVVILPFCYQMGGNTIIVKRSMVTPLNLSFEDGIKIALSGFVLSGEEPPPPLPKLIEKADKAAAAEAAE